MNSMYSQIQCRGTFYVDNLRYTGLRHVFTKVTAVFIKLCRLAQTSIWREIRTQQSLRRPQSILFIPRSPWLIQACNSLRWFDASKLCACPVKAYLQNRVKIEVNVTVQTNDSVYICYARNCHEK